MELTVIQTKIYEIRGQKVMLDFDLAELYQVNTKRLNKSVKRNSEKFPEDFMFRLSIEEWSKNWSQIATSSKKAGKGISSPPLTSSKKHRGKVYLPYAFTEHGVTMLASVLKSECAVKMPVRPLAGTLLLYGPLLPCGNSPSNIRGFLKNWKN